MKLELQFGALAQPIKDQLKKAGLTMRHPVNCAHYQNDADAITRIVVRGLISDSQARTARQRLMNRIAAGIREGSEK